MAEPGLPHDAAILIRSWVWLHAASLFAVILQPSTPRVFFGRYSRNSFLVLLALALSFPIVARYAGRLGERVAKRPPGLLSAAPRLSIVALTLAILGLWAVDRGSSTPSHLVIRLYLTVVLASLNLWTATRLEPGSAARFLDRARRHCLVAVVGIVGLLAFASWSLPFPGLFWTDEGYNTSLALSFVRTGSLEAPIFSFAPAVQGPNYSLVYMGLGVWYRLFGVQLGAARLFTLLVGIAGVSLLYRTAATAYSRVAAFAAALVALLSIVPNNFLRADVSVMAYLGLAFYWLVQPEEPRRHVLIGLASGFGLDGHPNAYRFALAFAVAYVVRYGRGLVSQKGYRPLLLLGAGQLVGVGLYVALYGCLAPDRFLTRLGDARLLLHLTAAPRVWGEQALSALKNAPLLLGLAILGVAAAFRHRRDLEQTLLIVVGIAPLALGLFYGYYRDYYLMHMFVPFGLLGACAIQELLSRFAPERRHVAAGVLTLQLLAAGAGRLTWAVWRNPVQDYHEALDVAKRIRSLLPRTATFVGVDPFYLGMYDFPRFVEFNTGHALSVSEEIGETAAWNRIRPDAVALVEKYPIPMPVSLREYVRSAGLARIGRWWNPKLGTVELFSRLAPGAGPTGDARAGERP